MTDDQARAANLVPPQLAANIRAYHGAGPAWLEELPELVARCVKLWDLTLLPAFVPGGESSWVAPVRRSNGDPAVLQLTVPTPVVHDHVTALRAWDGRGAVQLFEHEPSMRATLMERCVPGTDAVDLEPSEADTVAIEVLPQLWSAKAPASPEVETLATACDLRADVMDERAEEFGGLGDPGPFREAAALFRTLPASSAQHVLLHGDFTRRNVLRSERGWLATDPSSMVGDPSFDAAMFLQHDHPGPERVNALANRLGLDQSRTRLWLFALVTQGASWFLAAGDRPEYDACSRGAAALL